MNLRETKRRAEWAQLGWAALSFALSYLAGKLLAKKSGLKVDDDKPTTLTTRGSYMNYVLGRRRIGPLFASAPPLDREIKKEKAKGGKGLGSSAKTEVYYEVGWHVLGSNGPYWAMHGILQNGKVLMGGTITRDSHPSGTTVDLGKEGSFTIYWGEEDQPINAFLGDADRVGVTSRWPFKFYVVWNKKRLGTTPTWPVLDYIVTRRPELGLLTLSQSYYEPTRTLTGATFDILGHVNGAEGVGHFTFSGDATQEFQGGTQVELVGNAMADGTYDVLRSETVQVVTGVHPFYGTDIVVTRTEVYLYGGVTAADDNGTMQQYEDAEDDGFNPAHLIAEALFAPWPQGLGLDPDGDEPWDIDSLEEMGVQFEAEGLRASYVAVNGEKASSMLAAFMQDYGFIVPIDSATGKLKFQLIREPSGTLPVIAYSAQVGSLAEIEKNHGERPADRLIFRFADREQAYGDMTIGIGDDAQASFEENQRSRVVEIPTTVNFRTAAIIAERRSQEILAGAGVITIAGARGARTFVPGQAFLADGVDPVLRVLGVEFSDTSSLVQIKAMVDYYGARASDFVNQTGGGGAAYQPVQPDEQFDIIEVPEHLLDGDPMTVVIPRIRAHNQILSADLWISRDDTTYTLAETELDVQTGGTLSSQLDATDMSCLAQGPTFDALGPDIATVMDLSADATNWRLGRQLCVIVSDAGVEICFLQNVTALGGSSYRLDGLLRARYDTVRLTHTVGARVYIFENTSIAFIQDLLLVPAEELWGKTQPNASSGQLPLPSVSPVGVVLRGKGLVPMDPIALTQLAPFKGSPAYATGNDATFSWGYRSTASPKTGAGSQGAGVACGVSAVEGDFLIEFLTTANVLKHSVVQQATSYTYTNADLVTHFAGEPAAYKIRVTLQNGGFSSDYIELTVTKV